MKHDELARIARDMGLNGDELRELAEDITANARSWEQTIAQSEQGTVVCNVCNGDARFTRTGLTWSVHCDCGNSAAGKIPESAIQRTRH